MSDAKRREKVRAIVTEIVGTVMHAPIHTDAEYVTLLAPGIESALLAAENEGLERAAVLCEGNANGSGGGSAALYRAAANIRALKEQSRG